VEYARTTDWTGYDEGILRQNNVVEPEKNALQNERKRMDVNRGGD